MKPNPADWNPGRLFVWLLVILTVTASVWQIVQLTVPPAPVAEDAPATEFSAFRARQHLRIITHQPHPAGSEAHAAVRAYLLRSLRDMGLFAEVQRTDQARMVGSSFRIASVQNVLAKLSGSQSGANGEGAILLMSHYDSVLGSPGATDAGNGVAAILETVRALQTGPPLKRDLIVLISDAEEVGLMGAQAFVDKHRWARDIDVVLNFEGRGFTGPVSMFRTIGDNRDLLKALAELDSRVTATSVTDAVFSVMPNDTDLSVFKDQDVQGLDFANAHGLTHYHQPLDSYENADPGSLQHHGEYALGMVRLLDERAIDDVGQATYFSLPGLGLIHFPAGWGLPLMLIAMALMLLRLIEFWRWQDAPFKTLAWGLLGVMVPLFAAASVAHLMMMVVQLLVVETGFYFHDAPHYSFWYLLALLGMAGSAGLGVFSGLKSRISFTPVLLAALLVWACLGLYATLELPGLSYIFFGPVLLALAVERLVRRPSELKVAAAAPLVILLIWLILPVILLLEVMLTLNLVAICAVLLGLMMIFSSPWLARLQITQRIHRFAIGLLLVSVSGLIILLSMNRFVWDFAQPNSVGYGYLTSKSSIAAMPEQGEAIWYSRNDAVDRYIGQLLGSLPERGARPEWGLESERWLAPARALRTDAPDIQAVGSEYNSEPAWLATYPDDSYFVEFLLEPAPSPELLQINDIEIPGNVERVQWFAPPDGGLELSLRDSGENLPVSRIAVLITGIPQVEDLQPRDETMLNNLDVTYMATRIE